MAWNDRRIFRIVRNSHSQSMYHENVNVHDDNNLKYVTGLLVYISQIPLR